MNLLHLLRRHASQPSRLSVRLAEAKVRLAEVKAKASVTAWGERGWTPLLGGVALASEGSFDSWSTTQLAQQYSKHSLVRACIDEIAKSIQDGTLQVGQDTENGFESQDIDELLDPLYNDPDYSFGDIFMLVIGRLMSTGASFNILGQYADILGAGEFTPIPTNHMRVYTDGLRVTHYEYQREQMEPKRLKREEVCPLWFPDPAKQIGWVSPLASAAHAYQIDEQREALTHETLKNRVLPGGIIQSLPGKDGRQLTQTQADELKGKIEAAIGVEASKRGGLLAIPHGLEFKQGQNLEDIDFAVLNALTETRICMAFGVPPIVIAAKSGLDAGTYANYREARRGFYVETIRPLWSFLATGLTRALILQQGLGRKLYYRWKYDEVSELQRDATQAMQRATQGYTGQILTLNEARAEAGKPPVEDESGEMRYAPPVPAPSLFTGFGKSFGESEMGGKRAPAVCDCHGKAGVVGPLPEVGPIQDAFRRHFKRQRTEALAALSHGGRPKFDPNVENDKLQAELEPALRSIYEARGKRFLARIAQRLGAGGNGKGKRFQGKAFNPDSSFSIYRASVNDLLAAQLKKLVRETNETTRADLNAAIDRATAEAAARQQTPDLRQVVGEVFDGATEWRAKMIAQTESSRAIHDSTVMAAQSSGVVKGFLPIIGADACEVCLSHEGEFTSLADAQSQMGQYEGRGLPPYHPSDRCGTEEVLEEEAV